jgi:hypothetical protein
MASMIQCSTHVIWHQGVYLIYIISVCVHIVVSNTYRVVFLMCFSSSMLPDCLGCPFLIAPSVVFFNLCSCMSTLLKTHQKHNTICVGHHYVHTNRNNVNKIYALLQTTSGKDVPNIDCMPKS